MKIIPCLLAVLSVVAESGTVFAQQETTVTVDMNRETGKIRPLNGGQLSPFCYYKLLDLSAEFRDLHIPLVRLHDAPWFNENVVDIHTIFKNFTLDPGKEENYDFRQTDHYLASLINTGTGIVYRLGESIEHSKEHYYVNPPDDPSKWAQVCCSIIRHYTEGWANGFHYNIKYWEIWNEPDGSPATWNGSAEEFYKLYATAAKMIKKEFPEIMVGGPGMARPLKDENGTLMVADWTAHFLEYCSKNSVPLDFFSWHDYNDDPWALSGKAARVREFLDERGFKGTESHLNEWNYIPDDEWGRLFGGGIYQGLRRRQAYEKQSGNKGAAFVADVLMLLQDQPLDVANFYTTTAGMFGIFSEYGEPHKTYYAFRAFAELLDTPERLETDYVRTTGIVACAGKNQDLTNTNILISNFRTEQQYKAINLTVKGTSASQTNAEIYLLDVSNDLKKIREFRINSGDGTIHMQVELPSEAVMLIKLHACNE